jgi:hypothetical protein
MSEELEQEFAAAVEESIRITVSKYGYQPTGIMGMLTRRTAKGDSVVDVAVDLIHAEHAQSGFMKMWEISKKPGKSEAYEVTIEWLVTRPKYRTLFPAETISEARKRLHDVFGIEA